jgi:hypothetical protein
MSDGKDTWNYDVLAEYNECKYKERLTTSHIVGEQTPIKVGEEENEDTGKMVPKYDPFYVLIKDRKKYALHAEHLDALPIIVKDSDGKKDGPNWYEMITSYASVKAQEKKVLDFRELVDSICPFEHSNPLHFTLWKIITLCANIDRVMCRVATDPGFGKDSVVTCAGELLGDTAVLNKPSDAKVRRELTNKVLLINEMGTFSGQQRKDMEDMLLALGDKKSIYINPKRATNGTEESYRTGSLSMLLTFNTLQCYKDPSKYFDFVFNDAVYDRFLSFKFNGSIQESIAPPLFPKVVMEQNKEYYLNYIRSIMFYMNNFQQEASAKGFKTKIGKDYPLSGRSQNNFNILVAGAILYAKDEKEAQGYIDEYYKCHVAYEQMVKQEAITEELKVSEFSFKPEGN